MAHLRKSSASGHLLKGPYGRLVEKGCAACTCSGADWQAMWRRLIDYDDYSTACNGIYPAYRIAGYVDGDLTVCNPVSVPYPIWAGTYRSNSFQDRCWWAQLRYVSGHEWHDYMKIDGGGYVPVTFPPALFINEGCWELHVYEYDLVDLWVGRKATGATPEGIYTRTGGCNASPSSLALEPFIP